jgi:hypothetical protein
MLTHEEKHKGQSFVQLISAPGVPKSKWRYLGRSVRMGGKKDTGKLSEAKLTEDSMMSQLMDAMMMTMFLGGTDIDGEMKDRVPKIVVEEEE